MCAVEMNYLQHEIPIELKPTLGHLDAGQLFHLVFLQIHLWKIFQDNWFRENLAASEFAGDLKLYQIA
ncbi:hypothetical protein ACJX0J_014964, partial [Zea mays]